jgi:lysophospholipase L1-like esterase
MTKAVLMWLVLSIAGSPALAESRRFDLRQSHPSAYDPKTGFGYEPGAPNRYSVAAAEGNYRVTVEFAAARDKSLVTVLAEQRRFMAVDIALDRRHRTEVHFIVNVRSAALGELPANASGGTTVRLKPREIGSPSWDEKLTLEFVPRLVTLDSISIDAVELPTLYLAGDSTVTDQPIPPNASWGQFLPAFFQPDIAVANHAESGETLKSFVTEQRLDKLLSRLRAGDWVMIQFGHNDQKTQWPQTFAEAATTYRAWLRTYLAEIRRRGATPLLVTPPDRRNFDAAGHIVTTLGDYPESMRAVAREERVALIDLNPMSRRFYEALGPTTAPRAFADDGNDKTHFNEYGANALARCVVEGLRAADPALTFGLEKHLEPGLPRFDPDHPAPPSLSTERKSK